MLNLMKEKVSSVEKEDMLDGLRDGKYFTWKSRVRAEVCQRNGKWFIYSPGKSGQELKEHFLKVYNKSECACWGARTTL
jgi:hypothetical protein